MSAPSTDPLLRRGGGRKLVVRIACALESLRGRDREDPPVILLDGPQRIGQIHPEYRPVRRAREAEPHPEAHIRVNIPSVIADALRLDLVGIQKESPS